MKYTTSDLQFPLQPAHNQVHCKSQAYSIYSDKVIQGEYTARAVSQRELTSDYRSHESKKYHPTIQFKFSINSRDNEMPSGRDHLVTLRPVNGKCVTTLVFGQQLKQTTFVPAGTNLPENTLWTIRLDMRKVLSSFEKEGFFTLFNGEILAKTDFRGVYVAGNAAPLSWDFNNLPNKPGLQLLDPDGDGIFETTLIMNNKQDKKQTAAQWKLTKDIPAFPQYSSGFPVSDALYTLAAEEMINAVEPDSTFRAGKEWAGVWTRDISYSIILSMAYLQPKVTRYSLLRTGIGSLPEKSRLESISKYGYPKKAFTDSIYMAGFLKPYLHGRRPWERHCAYGLVLPIRKDSNPWFQTFRSWITEFPASIPKSRAFRLTITTLYGLLCNLTGHWHRQNQEMKSRFWNALLLFIVLRPCS